MVPDRRSRLRIVQRRQPHCLGQPRYVTTRFARSLDSEDADFARVVYERMEQVHETLLAAALLLLAAGAAATLGSRLANRVRRSDATVADTTA